MNCESQARPAYGVGRSTRTSLPLGAWRESAVERRRPARRSDLSFFLTRLLASLLFGVTATDPLTFAGVSAAMLAIAIRAALVPAQRAISIDPMQALGQE
ncbi:MAG TPA: hypothetical protein VGK64_27440 [Bryobacteraceae bacterium]